MHKVRRTPHLTPTMPGRRFGDRLLAICSASLSTVFDGIVSWLLRFPRPWWRGYGLWCCPRFSVAPGPKHRTIIGNWGLLIPPGRAMSVHRKRIGDRPLVGLAFVNGPQFVCWAPSPG